MTTKILISSILLGCGFFSSAQGIDFNAESDAFVRGGVYSATNYGTDTQLSIKDAGGSDFDRKICIQFNLKSLAASLNDAVLILTPKTSGADFNGSSAQLSVVSNSWNESTVNWDNSPSTGAVKTTVLCSSSAVSWDVSNYISTVLNGDSIVSFLLEIPTEGTADSWAHYYSREATIGQPKLVINGGVVSSILPEDNQVDWSIAGVVGGIPNYTNQIDVTTMGVLGDDQTDNSTTFQALIDNADAGTEFYFPSGIFLFNSSIRMKDSITVKGNCVSNTTLKFDLSGTAEPSFWFKSDDVSSTATSITAGFEKGSSVITVVDPTGFKVGGFVEVLQDNDSALMYTSPTWNVSWAAEAVGQIVEIVSISGSDLTLKSELQYDFSSVLNVRAKWMEPIQYSGIENFKLFRVDDGNDYNIRFDYAANCWVRNLEGEYADRGHFATTKSAHLEVRESYFHHAYDYGGGGHGYGVNLQDHTTSCLIENNIFHYLRHTFLAKEGAIGNVFAYNYSINPNGSVNDIALHGHFGLMNLMEGNVVQKIIAGDYWGPSGPGNTYFRNRVETADIVMQDATHSQNIVGNELVNGTISITASNNTWQLSNKNGSGFIDNEYSGTVPSSLYLNQQPEFLNGYTWPGIGPEYGLNQNTIPAEIRWTDNSKDLVPCLDVDVVTNTKELKNSIQIYPNPTTDKIFILGDIKGVIQVYSLQGELLISTIDRSINLEGFAKGVYVVRLLDGSVSKKIHLR